MCTWKVIGDTEKNLHPHKKHKIMNYECETKCKTIYLFHQPHAVLLGDHHQACLSPVNAIITQPFYVV